MSLAQEISERTEFTKRVVAEVLDVLEDVVRDTLKTERRVRIPGLAVFAVKYRPAKPKRMGRNPGTGDVMQLKAKPASNKLRITPVKELKEFAGLLPVVEAKKKKRKG